MKKKTTLINEYAKASLGLSRDEYACCDYIYYRCADPRQKKPGWCCDPKEDIATFVGVTRQGLHKMTKRMEAVGLLESCPLTGFFRATALFIDAANEAEHVNKVDAERKQSLREDVNKVYTGRKQSLHHNKEDISKSNKEDLERSAGAKSAPLHPETETDFSPSTQPGEAEKKAPPVSAPPPPQKPAKKTKRDCPFDLNAAVAELPRTLNDFAELVNSGHWGAWIEYRLALKPVYPYATERGFKTQLQELSNKSHGNADTAKQIIDQSIGRGWTGFVAIRAETNYTGANNRRTVTVPVSDNYSPDRMKF